MKTFVISLKESTKRRDRIEKLLLENDIKFTFFDAVNVKTDQTSILEKYNPEKTQKYKGYTLTNAEIGCFASHIKLWELSVSLNEPIFVLEDNIEVKHDLKTYLSYATKNIKNLGIIKFGSIFTRRYKVFDHVDQNVSLVKYKRGACGTSGYIISPVVAKRYLELSKTFYLPVDDFIDEEFKTDIPIFTFYPSLICRSDVNSTIGKRKLKNQNQNMINKFYREYIRIRKQIEQIAFNIKFLSKKNKYNKSADIYNV